MIEKPDCVWCALGDTPIYSPHWAYGNFRCHEVISGGEPFKRRAWEPCTNKAIIAEGDAKVGATLFNRREGNRFRHPDDER